MGGERGDRPASPHFARPGGDPTVSHARDGDSDGGERITVLGLYWMTSFWSLGPHAGANSFFLAPQGFARFGHEIHVSAPRGRGQPAIEIDEGMVIHRFGGAIRFDSDPRKPLPVRLTSRALRWLYYLVLATWNGWRLGRRIKPDLVVAYHYHPAVPAFLVARLLGLPNLTRLFGTQLNRVLDRPLRRAGAFIQLLALRVPASFLVMHDDGSEGDQVARRLGVPAERLRFWRDGYDPEMYRPNDRYDELRGRLGIPVEHRILFCVGRMEEDKRMDRLVEMLPDVLREEPAVTLLLVGDGGDRPMIESMIRRLGVERSVVLTGAVPRSGLPPFFNLGDIFVGTSGRTNANLPPIEAMSCAKPVVALATGGTRHLVEDGITGLLVDPARWRTELPRAIVSLVRDPQRSAAMGRAGLEKVQREIPTIEERQRREVELALQAVREHRARGRRRPPS
jgi:glycosyltransferase involved in cell wall biosynthesis